MVFLQVLVAVPVLQGKPGAYRQSATAGREDLPPGKLERMRRSLQSLNVEGKCYRNNMQLHARPSAGFFFTRCQTCCHGTCRGTFHPVLGSPPGAPGLIGSVRHEVCHTWPQGQELLQSFGGTATGPSLAEGDSAVVSSSSSSAAASSASS